MRRSPASVRTEAVREFAKEDYLKAVAKAHEYVMAGDLMQVQIGQRIRKPYVDSPLSLYRALRSLNPSPYMYFYNFGDMQIVGASPEIWCATRRADGEKSRCARSPAPARAAPRRSAMPNWPRNCWPTQRNRRTRDADRPGAQ
jgi:anthranilate synthase component 1